MRKDSKQVYKKYYFATNVLPFGPFIRFMLRKLRAANVAFTVYAFAVVHWLLFLFIVAQPIPARQFNKG